MDMNRWKPEPGFAAVRDEGKALTTARAKTRILLVDDDALTAESLESALNRFDYSVVCFQSSLEALTSFQRDPREYDLVLTDQRMPELKGDELAQEMLHIRPDIPIILFTGFTGVMTDTEAKTKGIREFLEKPFSLHVLIGTIRRVLEEYASFHNPVGDSEPISH